MKPDIFTILNNRLKLLYKLRKKSSSEVIEDSIFVLEYILKEKNYQKNNNGLISRLNQESKKIQIIDNYKNILIDLSESSLLPLKEFNIYSLEEISSQRLFEFTHNFFKEYTDKNFYQYFSILYNNKENLLYETQSKKTSYSFYLPYTQEHFIFFERVGTIEDFPEIVHEYGHGIANLINYNYKSQKFAKKIFTEIASTFFEMLANLYLKNNDKYNEYQQYMDLIIFNNYVAKSVLIREGCTIMKLWSEVRSLPDPLDALIREYYILFGSSVEDPELFDINLDMNIESLLDNDITNTFAYILGYVFSIELLMIYVKDKEKALYILKQLILIDWNLPNKKYFKEIIKLGLIPNTNLNEYKAFILSPMEKNNGNL